jgi:hypothetical protein
MSKKETGGPAFPLKEANTGDALGMTLRDHFAGQALATIPAYHRADVERWEAYDFAHHAYQIADAMLAERAK